MDMGECASRPPDVACYDNSFIYQVHVLDALRQQLATFTYPSITMLCKQHRSAPLLFVAGYAALLFWPSSLLCLCRILPSNDLHLR